MHPKFSSANLRPKFLQFSPIFLSTQLTRQRKRKKWSRLPKVRALCSFPTIALFLSLSLSLLFFFLCVRILSLSPFARLCVCVGVGVCLERPDLRLGVLFPFQPQVLFWCSHVLTFNLCIITSSFNSVCCIGAGYVGGPTMAMIALKCPHIEVIINIIFLWDDDAKQSAGEKEMMDSHDLLSFVSLKIAFVWELLKRLSLSNLSLSLFSIRSIPVEREIRAQRLLPDAFIFLIFLLNWM